MFSVLSSVTPIHDQQPPAWIVLGVWLLAVSLLAFTLRRYWPGAPFNDGLLPESESPQSSDTSVARSVTTIAFGAGLMLMLAHLIFALKVVPIFENMYASVSLSLPGPTRIMMALSRGRLLAPSYSMMDTMVLLLWFRFGRRTWVQLFLVLGAVFAVITVGSLFVLYQPMLDMINAVQ